MQGVGIVNAVLAVQSGVELFLTSDLSIMIAALLSSSRFANIFLRL